MENQPPSLPNCIAAHWKGWVLVLMPLLYAILVVAFGDRVVNRLVYLNVVMLILYISEVLPIGLTSLLPIGFFPLQNILKSEDVCFTYFHPLIAEFILGTLLLTSMEATKFHQREALIFIQLFGPGVKCLHIAVVVLTTILSILLPNGIAAAIMFFLTRAILTNLSTLGVCQLYTEETKDEIPQKRKPSTIVLGFYLSIAYAANLAGGCTLTSTAANTMMRDSYDKQFPNSEETVSFDKFMRYGMAPSLLNIILMIIYMQILFFGMFRPESAAGQGANLSDEAKGAASAINKETLTAMGPMNVAQLFSLLILAAGCVMMMTREPEFTSGWAEKFNQQVLNSSPLALCAVIMFMSPAALNFLFCWDEKSGQKTSGLITWKAANVLVPWELIFIIGFSATSELAFREIKFNKSVGEMLAGFNDSAKPQVAMLKAMLLIMLCTNYMCNFAAMSAALPGLMELALKSKVHPLYFMLPGCLTTSLSFTMPTCSMSVALVKNFVNVSTFDLMVKGIGPLVISWIVLYVWAITGGLSVYNLKDSPAWLTSKNMDMKYF